MYLPQGLGVNEKHSTLVVLRYQETSMLSLQRVKYILQVDRCCFLLKDSVLCCSEIVFLNLYCCVKEWNKMVQTEERCRAVLFNAFREHLTTCTSISGQKPEVMCM